MRVTGRGFISAALVATLASAALLALPVATAGADTTTPLSITGFFQIVADTAHGHLFISQGTTSSSEIIVTNLAGGQVATIGGQSGVMGLALSPDGDTLYAALNSGHAVTAIDTATLQQTAEYSVGDQYSPVDIAVQSGKVWVSYDTGTVGDSGIGDIDLSATSPTFQTQSGMGLWYDAPELAADPQDSGVLVAAEPGMSPASVASYDVSPSVPTVLAQSSSFTNCSNEADLAVVPGGSEFVLACANPYAQYRYSTADLSQQGSYASTNYPDAVAIAADGTVAAGTQGNAAVSVPDVYVYAPDGSTPLNTFDLNAVGGDPAPRGLAWSANGQELFAVVSSYNDTTGTTSYALDTIDQPLAPSELGLTGPSRISVGKSIELVGSLTAGSGSLPAGTTVTVTRTLYGSSSDGRTFTITPATDGSFSLSDSPPSRGTYVYTASYGGTDTVSAATAIHTVVVVGTPTSLTLTAGPATVDYGTTVHVTAHLGSTYSSRTVSIYAQSFGSAHKILLKRGRVSSSGNLTARGKLTVSYVPTHSTTFSAVFAGDTHSSPATATRAVLVRARVTVKLSGYYGSRRSGHTTYLLYHHTAHVNIAATVAPNKHGECVIIQVQEYYRGKWHANSTTGCGALNASSKVSGYLTVNRANRNVPYRLRAEYVRSTTDVSNLSNNSAWQYILVER